MNYIQFLKKENINAMYIIKAGNKDELTNYFSVNFTSFSIINSLCL